MSKNTNDAAMIKRAEDFIALIESMTYEEIIFAIATATQYAKHCDGRTVDSITLQDDLMRAAIVITGGNMITGETEH